MTAAIEISELDSLFTALRDDATTSLPQALQEAVALAKRKGMSAAELEEALKNYGIEGSPKFTQWLKEQFR
jgi:hypothetical protein